MTTAQTTWLTDIRNLTATSPGQQRRIDQIQSLGMPNKKQELWRYAPLETLFEKITAPSLGSVQETASETALAAFDGLTESNVFVPTTLLAPSECRNISFEAGDSTANLDFVFDTGWQQPHVMIEAKEGANVTLRIHLKTPGGAGHVLCHLNLADTANVHIDIVGQTLTAPVLVTLRAVQGSDSNLNIVSYIQDSPWFMLDLGNAINGTGSDMTLDALSLVRQNQYAGVVTNVRHNIGESTSRQLVKTVLYDTATTEYNGAVYVAPDAQKTDSVQSNPNLVLSDTARALSRPQLRIYADDVKCAHGATMGQLDPEPLFYLASRGFSHQAAISMVLAGFAEEVLDQMSDPKEQKSLLADAIGFLRA